MGDHNHTEIEVLAHRAPLYAHLHLQVLYLIVVVQMTLDSDPEDEEDLVLSIPMDQAHLGHTPLCLQADIPHHY